MKTTTQFIQEAVRKAKKDIAYWESIGIKWTSKRGNFGEPGEEITGPLIKADKDGPNRRRVYWRPKNKKK